ncbi:MAG: alkaline shock response membrane anchor protein AmaP [Clostridia bacterium]|nr:alkaline shock response membrane anchor protein AmaP [Clostridia bacterium]
MNPTMDRIIIGILAFGYMVAAAILVVTALGWTTPLMVLQYYLLASINHWLLGITGAFLFILFLSLFISVFRSKPVRDTIVHETSLGSIKVTLPALENLVVKAARSVPGVREVKTQIKTQYDNTVSIQLKVQVQPDLNIPQMTEDLQIKVQEYMTKTTGINVHNVKVIVSKISWEAKSRVE